VTTLASIRPPLIEPTKAYSPYRIASDSCKSPCRTLVVSRNSRTVRMALPAKAVLFQP